MRLNMGVHRVLCCVRLSNILLHNTTCCHSTLLIQEVISECFKKCNFSKEQCSSLKMILGSKHVGAILNVLM